MTSIEAYTTGTALWRAVTDRARAAAKASGAESGALVRRFVFGRFLARVFDDPAAPWVLKGGTAVLARVHDARTTKDGDLLHQLGDVDAAVGALRAAARTDLGDHVRFVITKVEPNVGGQPGVDGARATIEAPTMRLYPLVDHSADKLCATQAMYGTGHERPSSRVRDPVDLVLLARSQDVDGRAPITAVHGEWAHRGLPGTPVFAPPADWERRYPPEARKTPAVADVTAFADAVTLVAGFLSSALDGQAAGRRWVAAERAWR